MKNIIKHCKNLEKKYDEKVIRTLKDMKKYYDKKEVKKILKRKNPVIYKVYIKKFEDVYCGLTVVNNGTIGKKYYHTKGHKHKKPSREIYILLEGKGKLMLQNKNSRIITLKKNKRTMVQKNYAHRLVNIGSKKLKVLAIYDPKAGHNYKVKFKNEIHK